MTVSPARAAAARPAPTCPLHSTGLTRPTRFHSFLPPLSLSTQKYTVKKHTSTYTVDFPPGALGLTLSEIPKRRRIGVTSIDAKTKVSFYIFYPSYN